MVYILLGMNIKCTSYFHAYDTEATLGKKATIHQLTTMLSVSKNGLFPGHNHLLTTGADDPTL